MILMILKSTKCVECSFEMVELTEDMRFDCLSHQSGISSQNFWVVLIFYFADIHKKVTTAMMKIG